MSEPIFPAATVVLVRDSDRGLEVLLLRRSKAVKFAGGSWVFPGGRIDDEDYAGSDDIEVAARNAAVRETMEEAALTVTEEDLLYYSHWTAPEQTPKRFATWFFVARADAAADVVVDGGEIDFHRWYTPAEALEEVANQAIQLMPPTFVTLVELAACQSVDEVLAFGAGRTPPKILPKMTFVDDGVCMLYPGDAGYEAHDNTLEGARHRFWMMPDGWRYEPFTD